MWNLKGIQDYLKLTKEQKQALLLLTKNNFSKDTVSYCISIFTDERNLVVNLGDLVDAISCHNPSYGAYIEVIPSYLLDANIKILLGYVISWKELSKNQAMAQCLDKLSQTASPAKILSIENGALLFKMTDESETEEIYLDTKRPNLRQVIKVWSAISSDNEVSIIMEPPLTQTHHALPYLSQVWIDHIKWISNRIGGSFMKSISIPISRNPWWTYSDIMDGIQRGPYTINCNHEN